MNRKPPSIQPTARSIEPRLSRLCGSRCNRPIPRIMPETKLIAICIRRCVILTSIGIQPPMSDPPTNATE